MCLDVWIVCFSKWIIRSERKKGERAIATATATQSASSRKCGFGLTKYKQAQNIVISRNWTSHCTHKGYITDRSQNSTIHGRCARSSQTKRNEKTPPLYVQINSSFVDSKAVIKELELSCVHSDKRNSNSNRNRNGKKVYSIWTELSSILLWFVVVSFYLVVSFRSFVRSFACCLFQCKVHFIWIISGVCAVLRLFFCCVRNPSYPLCIDRGTQGDTHHNKKTKSNQLIWTQNCVYLYLYFMWIMYMYKTGRCIYCRMASNKKQ